MDFSLDIFHEKISQSNAMYGIVPEKLIGESREQVHYWLCSFLSKEWRKPLGQRQDKTSQATCFLDVFETLGGEKGQELKIPMIRSLSTLTGVAEEFRLDDAADEFEWDDWALHTVENLIQHLKNHEKGVLRERIHGPVTVNDEGKELDPILMETLSGKEAQKYLPLMNEMQQTEYAKEQAQIAKCHQEIKKPLPLLPIGISVDLTKTKPKKLEITDVQKVPEARNVQAKT